MGDMKIIYQLRGWALIRPIRWFTRKISMASFGLTVKFEKDPYYHPEFSRSKYKWPNLHWWILYKTVGKFSLWLRWDAWRVFCNWEGGWRRTFPWPAAVVYKIGKTLSYPYHGGECYHCASDAGDPIELSEDETGKYFTLTDSGTSSTPDGIDHWFRGITTCCKCGYKQEYGDGSL